MLLFHAVLGQISYCCLCAWSFSLCYFYAFSYYATHLFFRVRQGPCLNIFHLPCCQPQSPWCWCQDGCWRGRRGRRRRWAGRPSWWRSGCGDWRAPPAPAGSSSAAWGRGWWWGWSRQRETRGDGDGNGFQLQHLSKQSAQGLGGLGKLLQS